MVQLLRTGPGSCCQLVCCTFHMVNLIWSECVNKNVHCWIHLLLTIVREALSGWNIDFPLGLKVKMSDILLTFSAVARRADVTRRTLYQWQRSGRFTVPPMPNTDPPRWHVNDIDEWLKPQSVPPAASAIAG